MLHVSCCTFVLLLFQEGPQGKWCHRETDTVGSKIIKARKAPDTFNFLRHVMRAILSVRPKCSHRWVSLSLKQTPLKPVQSLEHRTQNSAEQMSMRTKWFKHIAISTVQVHLLIKARCLQCGFWLRNSFCRGFLGGFVPPFFLPRKRPQKIPCKIHPENLVEKFPTDFCRDLFLKNNYRQTFFWESLIPIRDTELCPQENQFQLQRQICGNGGRSPHYRYRFALESPLERKSLHTQLLLLGN